MKISQRVEAGRLTGGYFGTQPGDRCGAFSIQGPCGERLMIVASNGVDDVGDLRELAGWEHVSVSCRRMPNWEEMAFVKDQFWDASECVVQYHPPKADHINNHPRCLHLWRPVDGKFPMPPQLLVGVKGIEIDGDPAKLEQAKRLLDADLKKLVNR